MEATAADESGLFSWLLPPVATGGLGMGAGAWGRPSGMQVGLPSGAVEARKAQDEINTRPSDGVLPWTWGGRGLGLGIPRGAQDSSRGPGGG